jgi:hypothetical protein
MKSQLAASGAADDEAGAEGEGAAARPVAPTMAA